LLILGIFWKLTKEHFLLLFPAVKVMQNFWQKWVGLHFGRFSPNMRKFAQSDHPVLGWFFPCNAKKLHTWQLIHKVSIFISLSKCYLRPGNLFNNFDPKFSISYY
jgi:hypothetical protein